VYEETQNSRLIVVVDHCGGLTDSAWEGPERIGADDEVRAAFAMRLSNCWRRLDDALFELVTLHDIPRAEIMVRVREAIDGGRPLSEDDAPPTATPPG